MYVCPSCHLEQDSKDGFCRDCGTQLIELRFCDSCGVRARGAEEFCRECGTKLPPIVPFEVKDSAADSPTPTPRHTPPPIDNSPSWLQGPDPAPPPRQTRTRTNTTTRTRQDLETPDWLKGPADPVSYPPMPTSRSTTRPSTPPAPTVTATPRTTLPRGSNPVPFAPAVAAKPKVDHRNRNLQALLGLFLALLSVMVAGNSLVLGLALVVVTVLVGGKPLLEILADGLHRVVDWIWEDPVLRKRILDE